MGEDPQGSSRVARDAHSDDTTEPEPEPGILLRLKQSIFPTGNVSGIETPEQALNGAQSGFSGLGKLRHVRVEDVMIPRAEIQAVGEDTPLKEMVKVFRESGFTRLPVFRETLDNPLGMVHLKDLALKFGFNGSRAKFALEKMMRPVLFVPPSMPTSVLLQKMQSDRKHMALVIDEYGGVDGLVTIEDLIEEIVGEIEDEHDVEEGDLWKQENPGRYIVQAKAPLDEFEAEIGIRLSDDEIDDEIDTLGGLVFMLLGQVPARGQVVKHMSGAEFHIVDADPRRIKRIRVFLPKSE